MARYEPVRSQSKFTLVGHTTYHPLQTFTIELEGYFEVELRDDGQLDLSVTPSGRFETLISSFETGNKLYDSEIQRRLDLQNFPSIIAEIVHISQINKAGRFPAIGEVTFQGITRRFEDDLKITRLNDRTIEIGGEITVDMRDFSVEPPKMFMLKVSPRVQVILKVVARRVD